MARFKPDELTIGDYMFHLIGTPKECIEKLNVYRDLGISELVLQFEPGGQRSGGAEALRGERDPRLQRQLGEITFKPGSIRITNAWRSFAG